jgi:heme oxygenase
MDPLQALRGSTQQLHAQLDRGLPLAQADASLADYALHLVVLRDWQQALSPWLSRTGHAGLALGLIAQDLADCPFDIDHSAEPVDLTPVHRVDDGSLAFCWGMAYVLEGSRLGGQVLYRRLRTRLAPHPLRYLGERGADGTSWGDTLKALRQVLATEEARRASCAGAVAAFQTLLRRFEEVGCQV